MKKLPVILMALTVSGPAHAATITMDLGGYLHLYAEQRQAYYQSGEEGPDYGHMRLWLHLVS
jgi:hypothetical protein